MLFYLVTFGGFSGLASSLSIYFVDNYGLTPVQAGYAGAACVFFGSLVRPMGGALADRIGGIRTLTMVYLVAGAALVAISTGPATVPLALGLFIAAMLGHIYIGTIGMQGAFEAMGEGTVDVNWAKEHHSLWLEQEKARAGVADAQRSATAAGPAE